MVKNVCLMLAVVLMSSEWVAAVELLTQPGNPLTNWSVPSSQPLPAWEAVVGQAVQERPVFGLYVWCGEYRTHRESIKQVGWRSIRVGGPMDDETMALFVEDNLEVMRTLCLRDTKKIVKRGAFETDEAFIAAYLKDVDTFLNRYGPGGSFFSDHPALPRRPVQYVEIMNEPNFHYVIDPREGVKREVIEAERESLYAKSMIAAYQRIKKNWPTVKVVGFGAGGASAGDLRFIEHVHQQNEEVSQNYDILSTHPYLHAPPEAWATESWGGYSIARNLDIIRTTLSKHKASEKPIWYTEIGWPVSKADGGRYDMGHNPRRLVSPQMQAAYVCRLYIRAMRLNVGRVHTMFAVDTDGYNAGFFLKDGTWRPSAHAVQTLIRLLPNPRFLQVVSDGQENLYAYGFSPDGNADSTPVLMTWNLSEPKTIKLRCDAEEVTITDMLGNSITRASIDGVLTIEVGPCPIYIAGIGGPGTGVER